MKDYEPQRGTENYSQDYSTWLSNELKPDVPEGKPFDAWRLQIKSNEEFDTLTSHDKLMYLSWFGSLAPTTHNTVPERFKLDSNSNTIDVYVDRGTIDSPIVLPASDPTGRQTSVSIGVVTQHMMLAAQSYGIQSRLDIKKENESYISPPINDETRYIPIASLNLDIPDETVGFDDKYLDAILSRKSDRKPYSDSQSIPNDFLHTLEELASSYDVKLHTITNKMSKIGLGTFQSMADTFVVNNHRFAKELGEWLLENDSVKLTGMRGVEFGFDDQTSQKYIYGLKGDKQLNVQDLIGFTLGGKSLMKDSSAIFAITIPEDNLEYQIKAGQLYSHVILLLHLNGFSTSTHAGITEVDTANKAFSASILRTNERPTVVFRSGKPLEEANQIRPHSSRPLIHNLILD